MKMKLLILCLITYIISVNCILTNQVNLVINDTFIHHCVNTTINYLEYNIQSNVSDFIVEVFGLNSENKFDIYTNICSSECYQQLNMTLNYCAIRISHNNPFVISYSIMEDFIETPENATDQNYQYALMITGFTISVITPLLIIAMTIYVNVTNKKK